MNKKIKLLTVLFSIGLLTLVSAVVVDYLSGTATANVSVESPMLNQVSIGGTNFHDSIDLELAHGGDTVTFFARTENLSDFEVKGIVENFVYNSSGLTCKDFESVNVTTEGDATYDLIDLGLCSEVNSNLIQFSYGMPLITWSVGQIDLTEINATFVQGALGDYVFSSKVVEKPLNPIIE